MIDGISKESTIDEVSYVRSTTHNVFCDLSLSQRNTSNIRAPIQLSKRRYGTLDPLLHLHRVTDVNLVDDDLSRTTTVA